MSYGEMYKYVCGKCLNKFYSDEDVLLKDSDFQSFGKCADCGKIIDVFKAKAENGR